MLLEQFERQGDAEVPIVFQLIADYFKANNRNRMRTVGLLRITPSQSKVRELGLYMSQGCYSKLDDAEPHVVANYLKSVLFEMQEPLISAKSLNQFAKLGNLSQEELD